MEFLFYTSSCAVCESCVQGERLELARAADLLSWLPCSSLGEGLFSIPSGIPD